MRVEIGYTITLSEQEAMVLKQLLGAMNDNEFAKFGVQGDDRELLRAIYGELIDTTEE